MNCLNCGWDISDLVYPKGTHVIVHAETQRIQPYCLICLDTLINIDEDDEVEYMDYESTYYDGEDL